MTFSSMSKKREEFYQKHDKKVEFKFREHKLLTLILLIFEIKYNFFILNHLHL